MMGGQSSKIKTNNPSVGSASSAGFPPRPVRPDVGSLYSADLSSYKRACELDPDLKSFDATLHERTNRVISSLAAGAESRALTLDSLVDVTGCFLEMNEEVVKLMIESKEDVLKNKDLSALVNIYFDSTIKTLDFCNSVENCVKRARISQLIIHFAVKQFERESEMEPQERVGKKKYAKTLEELRKFKSAGDPFKDDFFVQFEAVYEQQVALLEELHKQKIKLDRKMKKIKSWRKVSNMVFVTAFVSVLILSVVAAAVAAPPVLTAVAAALAVPVGSVGKWCSHLWKKYETAVKSQKDTVLFIKIGANVTKKHLENLRVLVENLEIEIETLQWKADFALREDEDLAVKLAIDEISRRLDDFMEKIERVGLHAAKCNKDITMARTIVLRHILSYPSNLSSGETLMEILPM